MKKQILIIFAGFFFAAIVFQSCEKEENENETNISSYGSDESHNIGQNCMKCHKSGGSGEGVFIVAGTVYDSTQTKTFSNATVKLYTKPGGNGTLVSTIEVDKNGNFYTTKNISFGSNLYPVVIGKSVAKYMGSSISNGQCNSCHGSNVDPIWVK